MPQFSRRTILAATDIVGSWSHATINRFLLEHALEDSMENGSCASRGMNLARYLINHPDYPDQDGGNLTDTVIGQIIGRAIESCQNYDRQFAFVDFRRRYEALHRALERDGFTVEDGTLRRTLPQAFDLPAADDEVHVLLNRFNFATSRGHLDQAIAAHARGDWAAANGQFRSFIESLFDSIAEHLSAGVPGLPAAGHQRRQWLANRNPPFFSPTLNEWSGQGTGFIESFFRRLHPAGAHPGLSDEEDSTFRFHLVLLVARSLLRRI